MKLIYLFFAFIAPAALAADSPAGTNYGADITRDQAQELTNVKGTASQTIALISGEMVGRILYFLGIIFLMLMLYAGFQWMTAAGNDAKVAKAQKLITMAVIGLIVIFAAYAITAFIGDTMPQ